MQLTHQQLHAYALGLASSSTVENGWRPLRIPAGMVSLYERTEAFKTRMNCPAAVRIRFNSNTQSIKISLRFGARAREHFKSALIVDSAAPMGFGPDEYAPTWSGEIFQQKHAVPRTFDIWLPHMAQTDILSLELTDGASLAPAPALNLRWLAYGDSITQGMTSKLPTETAIARTAIALHANVLNLGIGGADLDHELHQTIPPEAYDIVTIAYGTNDYAHNITPETYASRARLLIAGLAQKQPKPSIFLLTPLTWVGQTGLNKAGHTLADMRRALAPIPDEFPQVTLIAGDALIPDDEKYFVDKVHPNAEGFALYADKLIKTLAP